MNWERIIKRQQKTPPEGGIRTPASKKATTPKAPEWSLPPQDPFGDSETALRFFINWMCTPNPFTLTDGLRGVLAGYMAKVYASGTYVPSTEALLATRSESERALYVRNLVAGHSLILLPGSSSPK